MEHREERIVVETTSHRLVGTIQLPREGYRSRLTDFLNAGEREFFALTEVEVTALGAGDDRPRRLPFAAVSRRHVVLAAPLDAETA